MLWSYSAKRDDGRTVRGTVDAPTKEAAQESVQEKNLVILSLSEQRVSIFAKPFSFFTSVKRNELVAFTRELAVMAGSNMPLVQALKILEHQTSNDKLKIVASQIADDVSGGIRLSQAMGKHPKVFSEFFTSMVRAGEESGKLDEVLEYLADEQERDYETVQKIRGAMIYPLFVIGGLIVVGVIMAVFVLPRLLEIVQEAATTLTELPLPTRVLLSVVGFFESTWQYLVVVLAAAGITLAFGSRTNTGRRIIDRVILRIPAFGKLIQQMILVRMTQSLSTLLKGGVPLTRALRITAVVVGNHQFRDALTEAVKEVEDGRPITSVLSQKQFIPPMVTEMITVGERTGSIDQVLDELASFYRRESEQGIAGLVHIIEPAIIIVLGIGVGTIVAAVLLPLYSTVTQF